MLRGLPGFKQKVQVIGSWLHVMSRRVAKPTPWESVKGSFIVLVSLCPTSQVSSDQQNPAPRTTEATDMTHS